MQFYEAYSIEMGRIISLDTAIQALDVGVLEDPDKFLCPDVDCDAPLFIKALPEPQGPAKKRNPYFATRGSKDLHDTQRCEYYLFDRGMIHHHTKTPNAVDALKDPNEVDVFDLKRRTLVKLPVSAQPFGKVAISGAKRVRRNLNHFSLVAFLADRYERMGKRVRAQKRLRINSEELTYEAAFAEVSQIEARGLDPTTKRIFWGEAKLVNVFHKPLAETPDGTPPPKEHVGFRFDFTSDIFIDGKAHQGSFTIWNNKLEAYDGKKRMTRWIQEAFDDQKVKPLTVYVYAAFTVKAKGDKRYVDFVVESLDHLAF